MERSMKFRFVVVTMLVLLYPFSFSCAKESGQSKQSLEPTHSTIDKKMTTEGVPESTRWDEQDRYNRLLKEYVQSLNEAESDEERISLRRAFDEETRDYQNSLAKEKESLKKRDVEKEKQALNDEYQKKLRLLKQDHDKKVRRAEAECRRNAFGVETKTNRLELEPDRCQKRTLMEEEFKRKSKGLELDYNASLRELQKK